MRIVNVMLGRGLGGIEQAVVDYCEASHYTGHEAVAIVHPDSSVTPALTAIKAGVHTLSNAGAWDVMAALRLKRALKKIQPDICIAHGNRAVSLLRMAGAPRIVAAMHNYKITWEKLNFIFYPTQDLLRHLQAKPGRGQHFFEVPNMVRVPEVAAARARHAPPVIGAMGRFVAKKGFASFIAGLEVLKARGAAFKAVLAGAGAEEQALKAQAEAAGLGGILHFPGRADDKQAFFDAIDIFCLPSLHEPFGIVLLEAMAQGLAVVAAGSEGPSEILGQGQPGILVPKNDPAALAEALASLIAEPERALRLGQNAYRAARTRYDLPVAAQKLDLALQAVRRL